MDTQLKISNLHIETDGQEILHGVDLAVPAGEVHALMGPNGSGKSTLASSILGHPKYKRTNGSIELGNVALHTLSPDKRALAGVFLAFQSPRSIPGVTLKSFLKQTLNARRRANGEQPLSVKEFNALLDEAMEMVGMQPVFAGRSLNEGLSGGEQKRSEILQMALIRPTIAVLDEIDSGLDVDALKTVATSVNALQKKLNMGLLVITHYPRILNYVKPDKVHIMIDGLIASSGDASLAEQIEQEGYDRFTATA